MKKISAFFLVLVLAIAFTACEGAKKPNAPAEEPVKSDSTEQVVAPQPEPAAPTLSPAEMLKNFQVYAKAYGEAFNNIENDPKKFTDLSGQYRQKIDEMEQIKSQLNPTQLQAYQKAIDIIIKVNRGGK